MADLRAAIYAVVEEIQPTTDRGIFYQCVNRGIVPKLESAYKGIICRLLGLMRLDGSLPFDWITDNTRWMRKPATYSSLTAMLEQQQKFYRRALWDSQDVYVEHWLEKDALAGVLFEVTQAYDVPLMVTRGYASLSFLHSAAAAIAAKGKPAFIYYFGDFDESGLDIPRVVEKRLREFAPAADITFERVAVTHEQIAKLNLPMRPSKKKGQRGMGVGDWSVEVDAIDPRVLRGIARDCITRHLDPEVLSRTRMIEETERLSLANVIENLPLLRPVLTKQKVAQMTDEELLDAIDGDPEDNPKYGLLLDEAMKRGWFPK